MVLDSTEKQLVGRVLRASTVGYDCGTRSSDMNIPTFGAFVHTSHRLPGGPEIDVIGLIYAIRIDDDPLVRQLIMANNLNTATIRDQRENRMVPVEISVVNIGYYSEGLAHHSLPPRPAMSLDPVYVCSDEQVREFTESADFFRLVVNTSAVPAEELIAAAVRKAADARTPRDQRDFLVRCGRRLAQLMSHDLTRLNQLIRMIRP